MRRWIPELIALPLFPMLLAQGRHARRVTPRLPEAPEPCAGVAGSHYTGQPVNLLGISESPVAGVGVASHEEAITGQLAQALSARLRRPVAWRACGKNGVTVRGAIDEILPAIAQQQVDIALIAFGVNDTTAFRSAADWRRDLRAMLQELDTRCKPGMLIVSGVPPVSRFPALPQPLRWVLGLKADVLDRVARELAPTLPRTQYVPLSVDPHDPVMLAEDGYHPSARGCTAWAQVLAEICAAELTRST